MTQPAGVATVKLPVIGTVPRRWLYVGAGAVGIIVIGAYWLRRNRRASTADVTVDPALGSMDPTDVYTNPAPHTGGSDPVDSHPEIINTDDEWGRAVIADLTQLGWDTQYAATAVGRYLAGQPLDMEQANLIRVARAMRGDPPSGIAIVMAQTTSAPTPTPTTPTSSTTTGKTYVTVVKYVPPNPVWNSYFDGIAHHYGMTRAQLQALNPKITNVNLIYPGQQIRVA